MKEILKKQYMDPNGVKKSRANATCGLSSKKLLDFSASFEKSDVQFFIEGEAINKFRTMELLTGKLMVTEEISEASDSATNSEKNTNNASENVQQIPDYSQVQGSPKEIIYFRDIVDTNEVKWDSLAKKIIFQINEGKCNQNDQQTYHTQKPDLPPDPPPDQPPNQPPDLPPDQPPDQTPDHLFDPPPDPPPDQTPDLQQDINEDPDEDPVDTFYSLLEEDEKQSKIDMISSDPNPVLNFDDGFTYFQNKDLPPEEAKAFTFIEFMMQAAGFNENLLDNVLTMTETRRRKKFLLMQEPTSIGDRGVKREQDHDTEKYKKRRKNFLKHCSTPVSRLEILAWTSISIYTGIVKVSSIYEYFNTKHDLFEAWFCLTRMSKERFYFITSVIDFDVSFYENEIEECVRRCYSHTSMVAGDESINPLKIRNMCHHFFLACKPNPNGALMTTLGDKNKVMLAIRLRRRTRDDIDKPCLNRKTMQETPRSEEVKASPTTTPGLIISLTPVLKESVDNTTIFTDSLYGSLDTLTGLNEKGFQCVLKCRKDRPNWIFQSLVHILNCQKRGILNIGDYASMRGKIPGKATQFSAFSIVIKITGDTKKIVFAHILSTIHSPTDSKILEKKLDEYEEKDATIVLEEKATAYEGVIYHYNQIAPLIDQINSAIVSALPTYRFTRWKAKQFIFLNLVSIHNSYSFFQVLAKEKGKLLPKQMETVNEISSCTFKQYLLHSAQILYPVTDTTKLNYLHEKILISNSPLRSRHGNVKEKLDCQFCKYRKELYNINFGRVETTIFCKKCQSAICDNCYNDINVHCSRYYDIEKNMRSGKFEEAIRPYVPVRTKFVNITTEDMVVEPDSNHDSDDMIPKKRQLPNPKKPPRKQKKLFSYSELRSLSISKIRKECQTRDISKRKSRNKMIASILQIDKEQELVTMEESVIDLSGEDHSHPENSSEADTKMKQNWLSTLK